MEKYKVICKYAEEKPLKHSIVETYDDLDFSQMSDCICTMLDVRPIEDMSKICSYEEYSKPLARYADEDTMKSMYSTFSKNSNIYVGLMAKAKAGEFPISVEMDECTTFTIEIDRG